MCKFEAEIKDLREEEKLIDSQIKDLSNKRNAVIKQRFQLENYPYKDGDKVVILLHTTSNNAEEVTGVLEYVNDNIYSPRFYLRPFKKNGEPSKIRRYVFDPKKTILRFAEDSQEELHQRALDEALNGSYFGQE